MSERIQYLTEEGARKLRAELEKLINVERPEIARKLREAISQGDLSENADYADAKEQQAFLEGRIRHIEHLLRVAVIIKEDPNVDPDVVQLGSWVTVVEDGRSTPERYRIVGAEEANPREGRISNESPLGKALLGHRVGETVEVDAPVGKLLFTIKAVESSSGGSEG